MTQSMSCPLPVSPRVAALMPNSCATSRPGGSYDQLKTGGRKSRRAGRKSRRGGVSLKYSTFSKSKSKKAGRKSRKGGRK